MLTIRGMLPVALILTASVLLTGCLTRRQRELVFRQPTNRVIGPELVEPLAPGESQASYVYNQSDAQNICMLQLAPGARLARRYHKAHDLTLVVISGSAVVVVEDTRYSVEAGSAVFLPRYTAYAVLPHETEEGFAALAIYSPPWEGKDVVLAR